MKVVALVCLFFLGCSHGHKNTVSVKKKAQRSLASLQYETIDSWIQKDQLVLVAKELPLKASLSLDRIPWADTNWPTARSGKNWRWSAPRGEQVLDEYNYNHPSLVDLKQMSPEALSQLSPLEKFSIYISDYDYQLANAHQSDYHPGQDPFWAGVCEEWSMAALHYKEPQAVVLENGEGIIIPFGSSDVKALLAEYVGTGEAVAKTGSNRIEADDFFEFAEVAKSMVKYFGEVCTTDIPKTCSDVDARTFHLLLTNFIGLKNRGFIIDMWTNNRLEPRNYFQPAFAYEAKVIQSSPTSIEYITVVKTAADISDLDADFTDKVTMPQNSPRNVHLSDSNNVTATKTFHYKLHLNSRGEITDGQWIGKDQPDLLMFRAPPGDFKGYMEKLGEIYRPVF